MKEIVDQIKARLRDQGIEVPDEEIVARLKKLVDDFHVPEAEARRSVLNYFFKEHGVTPSRVAASQKVKVSDIKEPGKWIDLEIKVLQLWEPSSDTISQTGLIADDTGKIKFVKWARDNLPNMAEGRSYMLKKVVTDEFQGRFGIRLNQASKIEELSENVPSIERGPNQYLKIMEIDQPNRWIDIKAKVVQLWTSNSDAISQVGLIGDETGSIKFVKWAKADLPQLVEGQSYLFRNGITDEYQGRFSLKLSSATQIEELIEDIQVGSSMAEFSGAIVEIQKGSGLIKRCPICRRALSKGMCGEHGKVDGSYDLRIKASIDDGRVAQDILINRETTERLVGLTLEEAVKMALEALENEVVRGLIEERLVGRYYSITGPRVDRYILVETINEMPPIAAKDIDDMIRIVEVS